MDFFEQQVRTRRQSRLVLVLFVATMALIALVIQLLAGTVSYLSGQSPHILAWTTHSAVLIGGVWLTIVLGVLFRAWDVSRGGSCLARRFGAESVLITSRRKGDRELLNIVTEMAVAAGQPVPGVWVMRRESSINAFVVGGGRDIALVVSQGALDLLAEDELRGVVAHEFGHLVHGDLPLNMRLLMVLGGLMALDEVGRVLTGKHPNELAHPGVIVGFVLRAIGSVGVLAGKLFRAAFSRQREFLADASAVQFTRDTYGLASALATINEALDQVPLQSPYAAELAHLCFHTPARRWLRKALSTHPTPLARIDAIDPHFEVKRRKQRASEGDSTRDRSHLHLASSNQTMTGQHALNITQSGLSDRFELLVSDPVSRLAVLFALFASGVPQRREHYLSAIGFTYDRSFSSRVGSLYEALGGELASHTIQIIEQVAPALSTVDPENRRRLLHNLEKLVNVEGENNLQNYAALQLLRRRLGSDFPVLETLADPHSPSATGSKVRPLSQMGEDLALLMSMLVEATGVDPAQQQQMFERLMKCYTHETYPPRRSSDDNTVRDLRRAFDRLLAQPRTVREVFVQHCVEVTLYDGRQVHEERLLLNLIAASLDVELAALAA